MNAQTIALACQRAWESLEPAQRRAVIEDVEGVAHDEHRTIENAAAELIRRWLDRRMSKRRALIHGFQFLALFATILAAAVWS